MKRRHKIFVWTVVGFMTFSALALSLLVFLSPASDSPHNTANTDDQTNAFVCQTPTELLSAAANNVGIWPPQALTEALTGANYEDSLVGDGAAVESEADCLVFHYRLANADGTVVVGQDTFESGAPFTSELRQLIEGWKLTLVGMREGGVRRLFIPSAAAYQDGDLIFDVELLKIVKE